MLGCDCCCLSSFIYLVGLLTIAKKVLVRVYLTITYLFVTGCALRSQENQGKQATRASGEKLQEGCRVPLSGSILGL